MKYYRSTSRTIFNIFNYLFAGLFILIIIVPFVYIIAIAFSDAEAIKKGIVTFFPVGFNLGAFELIFRDADFIYAIFNTIALTIIDTFLLMVITLFAGGALANKNFKGLKIAYAFILIPLYFSGGLVPSYLWMNMLGMRDNYLSMILPLIVSPFITIIIRNSIVQLPHEMRESAEIDGAGEVTTLVKVIFPLVIPMVAAFTIIQAVTYWNQWYQCMLYIQNEHMYTLQYKLRNIMIQSQMQMERKLEEISSLTMEKRVHPQNIRMATMLVTIIPIMVIYPFLQKYFIHGIVVGAVKG